VIVGGIPAAAQAELRTRLLTADLGAVEETVPNLRRWQTALGTDPERRLKNFEPWMTTSNCS
jgi:hypothetical protein